MTRCDVVNHVLPGKGGTTLHFRAQNALVGKYRAREQWNASHVIQVAMRWETAAKNVMGKARIKTCRVSKNAKFASEKNPMMRGQVAFLAVLETLSMKMILSIAACLAKPENTIKVLL